MVRRLMSRRGESASRPQVTPYQQHELDDGWRKWENTKQELVLVKRQLAEKDTLVIQLKTGTRRLQETLRKKEKDLDAAFAILRSPQESKTTKTRKQELIDRLVSECMQRAVTAEALAEERKRELDRLKYSSKFLRFQELEIEIEECHLEIKRLRGKLETTTVPSAIVAGKLRVSSVPLLPSNGAGSIPKKSKLDPLSLPEDEGSNNQPSASAPTNLSATRMYSSHSAAGQVRVVPLAKYEQREGFVSKTRRRALEAEYYKQVRLAQLEVECELEENLHIRAAREAKRLQAIDLLDRQAELLLRSQQAHEVPSAPMNKEADDCTNEVQPRGKLEGSSDNVDKPEQGQIPVMPTNGEEDMANEEVDALKQPHTDDNNVTMDTPPQSSMLEENPQNEHLTDKMETEVHREKVEDNADRDTKELKSKTYEDDEFDASDEDTHGVGGVEPTVWNSDPNPQGSDQLDDHRTDDNDNNTNNTAWNVDPIPASSVPDPIKADCSEEDESKSVVWNLDPHPISPQGSTSLHDSSVTDEDNHVEEEVPNAHVQPEHSTQHENATTNHVWNLYPTVSQDDKLGNASDDETSTSGKGGDDVEERQVWNLNPAPVHDPAPQTTTSDDDKYPNDDETSTSGQGGDDIEDRQVWNLNPAPVAPASQTTSSNDEKHPNDEQEQSAWNLDPKPAADKSSSEELSAVDNAIGGELVSEIPADSIEEGSTSTYRIDQSSPNFTESVKHEGGESAWNLDPEPSSSSPNPLKDNLTRTSSADNSEQPASDALAPIASDEISRKTWNLDPSISVADQSDEVKYSGQEIVDSSSPGDQDISRKTWNMDPSILAADPSDGVTNLGQDIVDSSSPGVQENSNKTWNMDPSIPVGDPSDGVKVSGQELVDSNSLASNVDGEKSVWNLDPQAGDAIEPNNSATEMNSPVFEENDGGTIGEQLESNEPQNGVVSTSDGNEQTSSRSEAPTSDAPPLNPIQVETTALARLETDEIGSASPGSYDFDEVPAPGEDIAQETEPTENTIEDASNQNSARESHEYDDATPEYTPVSSARDESGDDNSGDTTW